jgi:ComF family protein
LPNPNSESEAKSKICGVCLSHPPAYTRLYTPFLYRPPIDRLLWQFKFHGNLAAGNVLGQLLASHIEQNNNGMIDMLVPVPLHWQRQFRRGFNQAYLLARTLGQIMDIPVNNKLVKRRSNTPSQQGLNRKQRQKNLSNSFVINTTEVQSLIKSRTIALIDDVVTTGSTVEAMAELLIDSGAAQVDVWSVARTPVEN